MKLWSRSFLALVTSSLAALLLVAGNSPDSSTVAQNTHLSSSSSISSHRNKAKTRWLGDSKKLHWSSFGEKASMARKEQLTIAIPFVDSPDRNEKGSNGYNAIIDSVEADVKSNETLASRDIAAVAAPVEDNRQRNFLAAPGNHYSSPAHYAVDFSPLFLALIPIALFLGAAAAFALSVATSSSSAVATAQQQQQQEENNNNNNANSANNNNNNALLAAFLNANNNNRPTIVIINNGTALGNLFPFFNNGQAIGRALEGTRFAVDAWKRRRQHRSKRHNRQ